MTENRKLTRIKRIFKDADEVRKDNVDNAKNLLDEAKKRRKKRRHYQKGSWSHRLFYGPGGVFGGGGNSGCSGGGSPAGGDAGGGDGGSGGGDGGGA